MQVISFNDIALPETLRRNLLSMGVSSPTPIQMESIPCILSNRDVLLCSNTGSGKTLAYLLPLILLQLDYFSTRGVFADFITCILVPNHELAIQIENTIHSLTQDLIGVRTALLIGGESRSKQVFSLHFCHSDISREKQLECFHCDSRKIA